jgi:hypothetical protein
MPAEGGKKSLTDESIREFQAICKWVVKRPMLITCAAASKYWNSTFVKACENCKVPAPPKLTPSHVELCLLNCNHNLKGLLTLRREIALLEDVLDVLESNQLFVRQEVANVPTNKYQVTQSGYKVYHDVVNQLITCRKLEWGAMTVIEHENEDSPVSVNPMHDSSYRPKKRTEITREREAYIAAQKRNNKNFRGSSGMGGNTGVGSSSNRWIWRRNYRRTQYCAFTSNEPTSTVVQWTIVIAEYNDPFTKNTKDTQLSFRSSHCNKNGCSV